MKQIKLKFIFSILFCYFATISCLLADPNKYSPKDLNYESKPSLPPQLAVEILQVPTPMMAEDNGYLVYELYLTNHQTESLNLSKVRVLGNDSFIKIVEFNPDDLVKMIHPVNGKILDSNPLSILPGNTKILMMWVPYKNLESIPSQVIHEILYETNHDSKPHILTVKTDPVRIQKTRGIILGPPLQGENWIAANGPSNTSDHRIAHMVMNGHDYFPQRYAIDFIKVDNFGQTYQGTESMNSSYYGYNQNVIAAAAGKVVDVKDGIPENVPHAGKLAVDITAETVGGNYVVIDMGNQFYAFYAHLVPGSLKVKKGDNVMKGQIIAKLGNSGNSSEPHLHFHVVDNSSFLASNGVPYGFDNFYDRPTKMTESKNGLKFQILGEKSQPRKNQLVLENALVNFLQ